MKKTIKISSVIYTLLWLIFLTISIASKLTYKAPTITDPLDAFMTKGIYNVFILLSVLGVICSIVLLFSIYLYYDKQISSIGALKKVTIIFSLLTNILLYISIGFIFGIRHDSGKIVLCMFILCMLNSLVLVFISAIKNYKLRRKRNTM